MYPERYRSHHDAETRLSTALGENTKGGLIRWETLEAVLGAEPTPGRRCVYIHIPYCDTICSFCNLNRKERSDVDLDVYTDYLVSEINRYAAYPYVKDGEFQAVYFGGGTPTVLRDDQLARILRALRASLNLSPDCEITLETTLHNINPARAAIFRDEGINRLSVGIQTFSDQGRRLLGRTFSGAVAMERMAFIRDIFDGTLGIDIIYSYPGQTPEEAAFDADASAKLKVDSASYYSLMIHDGSKLGKAIVDGELFFDRDTAGDRDRHRRLYEGLCGFGYTLLELSKLSLPGRDEYRYIRIRYDGGDVLPIGSGAGGNIANYRLYSPGPGKTLVSEMNREYQKFYRILGCLQFGRFDPVEIASVIGSPTLNPLKELMDRLTMNGLLVPIGGTAFGLTSDGVFWGNNMAVQVLETAIAACGREELSYD